MAASVLENLQRAKESYSQILVLLTQVIATPTQANIDAVVQAIDRAGLVRPKVTYSLDGESYAWTEYQQFILTVALPQLNQLIQRETGPWQVVSRMRP